MSRRVYVCMCVGCLCVECVFRKLTIFWTQCN